MKNNLRLGPTLVGIAAILVVNLGLVQGAVAEGAIHVKAFGAAGDGTALDTAVIQKAIDQCSGQGGGTVVFDPGHYLIGTLKIKSNVTLHLDAGAVLQGSTNKKDYENVDAFIDAVGQTRGQALIAAMDATDVAIEGEGSIDGQGLQLAAAEKLIGKYDVRPFLVRIIRCDRVAIKGIHMGNSGAWNLHLYQSKNIAVDNVHVKNSGLPDADPVDYEYSKMAVRVKNHGLPNIDGIDIDSCDGVKITHCDIDCQDDAICVKATSLLPSMNLTVTDCQLASACATIKIGTESLGDFKNIAISHCKILHAGLAGIKLCTVDGAHLENVTISDVQMNDVNLPIMLRLGGRLKIFHPGDKPRPVGLMRDVTIKNVTATNARNVGILLAGIQGHNLENITIDNVQLQLAGGGTKQDAAVTLPEKDQAYPEVFMFGEQFPSYALYARHVRGVTISNYTVTLKTPDARPASFTQDVQDDTFTHWQMPKP